MDAETMERLRAPFPPSEVHWRVGNAAKDGSWVQILAYVDARMVMDRLDSVFPGAWRDEYKPHPSSQGTLCGISVRIGDEWVTRWDGADATDVEAAKGVLSDAFKRAAVKWGIGRYLYELGTTWGRPCDKQTAQRAGKAGGSHKRKDGQGYVYWVAPNDALKAVGAKPLEGVAEPEPENATDPLADWRRTLAACEKPEDLADWMAIAKKQLTAEQRTTILPALKKRAEQLGTTIEALKSAA